MFGLASVWALKFLIQTSMAIEIISTVLYGLKIIRVHLIDLL